jgi:hypothetical protein
MFDPYQAWLGISKDQQPPNHYQLLGISPADHDRKSIEEAMIRQTARVRIYQGGPQGRLCTELLNQIAEAGTILLDPAKRQKYDEQIVQPTALSPGTLELPADAVMGPAGATRIDGLLLAKLAAFALAILFFLSGFVLFIVAAWLHRRG